MAETSENITQEIEKELEALKVSPLVYDLALKLRTKPVELKSDLEIIRGHGESVYKETPEVVDGLIEVLEKGIEGDKFRDEDYLNLLRELHKNPMQHQAFITNYKAKESEIEKSLKNTPSLKLNKVITEVTTIPGLTPEQTAQVVAQQETAKNRKERDGKLSRNSQVRDVFKPFMKKYTVNGNGLWDVAREVASNLNQLDNENFGKRIGTFSKILEETPEPAYSHTVGHARTTIDKKKVAAVATFATDAFLNPAEYGLENFSEKERAKLLGGAILAKADDPRYDSIVANFYPKRPGDPKIIGQALTSLYFVNLENDVMYKTKSTVDKLFPRGPGSNNTLGFAEAGRLRDDFKAVVANAVKANRADLLDIQAMLDSDEAMQAFQKRVLDEYSTHGDRYTGKENNAARKKFIEGIFKESLEAQKKKTKEQKKEEQKKEEQKGVTPPTKEELPEPKLNSGGTIHADTDIDTLRQVRDENPGREYIEAYEGSLEADTELITLDDIEIMMNSFNNKGVPVISLQNINGESEEFDITTPEGREAALQYVATTYPIGPKYLINHPELLEHKEYVSPYLNDKEFFGSVVTGTNDLAFHQELINEYDVRLDSIDFAAVDPQVLLLYEENGKTSAIYEKNNGGYAIHSVPNVLMQAYPPELAAMQAYFDVAKEKIPPTIDMFEFEDAINKRKKQIKRELEHVNRKMEELNKELDKLREENGTEKTIQKKEAEIASLRSRKDVLEAAPEQISEFEKSVKEHNNKLASAYPETTILNDFYTNKPLASLVYTSSDQLPQELQDAIRLGLRQAVEKNPMDMNRIHAMFLRGGNNTVLSKFMSSELYEAVREDFGKTSSFHKYMPALANIDSTRRYDRELGIEVPNARIQNLLNNNERETLLAERDSCSEEQKKYNEEIRSILEEKQSLKNQKQATLSVEKKLKKFLEKKPKATVQQQMDTLNYFNKWVQDDRNIGQEMKDAFATACIAKKAELKGGVIEVEDIPKELNYSQAKVILEHASISDRMQSSMQPPIIRELVDACGRENILAVLEVANELEPQAMLGGEVTDEIADIADKRIDFLNKEIKDLESKDPTTLSREEIERKENLTKEVKALESQVDKFVATQQQYIEDANERTPQFFKDQIKRKEAELKFLAQKGETIEELNPAGKAFVKDFVAKIQAEAIETGHKMSPDEVKLREFDLGQEMVKTLAKITNPKLADYQAAATKAEQQLAENYSPSKIPSVKRPGSSPGMRI